MLYNRASISLYNLRKGKSPDGQNSQTPKSQESHFGGTIRKNSAILRVDMGYFAHQEPTSKLLFRYSV